MREFIAKLVVCLIVGAFLMYGFYICFKIYGEINAKKAQKERLEFSRKRLHYLALKFRDDCMDVTNRVIENYTHVIANKGYRRRHDFFLIYTSSANIAKK